VVVASSFSEIKQMAEREESDTGAADKAVNLER
jgi:hypothetical protein